MRIFTIGGYGFTEQSFTTALKRAGVTAFVDVRQRRGMRGSKYAFLNSIRLQQLLSASGIKYIHALDLAPTPDVRSTQKSDDQQESVNKRDRTHLSPAFIKRYCEEVLEAFDPSRLIDALGDTEAVALFCVEGPPTACHRLLAAEHLLHLCGNEEPVEHLRP